MKENLSTDFRAAGTFTPAEQEVVDLYRAGKAQTLIRKLGGAADVEEMAVRNGVKGFEAKHMFNMENTPENAWRVIVFVGGIRAAASEIAAFGSRDTQRDGLSAPKP